MRVARHRLAPVVAVVLALLATSGCAAAPRPAPSPTASVAPEPVFASDEEALAAAEAAYAAYLGVENLVAQAGGAGEERFTGVARGAALERALEGARQLKDAGAHTEGETTFTVDGLQSAFYNDPTSIEIAIYICDDVSAVVLRDAQGTVLGQEGGTAITPWEVLVDGAAGDLLVADVSFWEGQNFCG